MVGGTLAHWQEREKRTHVIAAAATPLKTVIVYLMMCAKRKKGG